MSSVDVQFCAERFGRQGMIHVSTKSFQMTDLAQFTDFAIFLITGPFCIKTKTEQNSRRVMY
jgi:hypothetical protein